MVSLIFWVKSGLLVSVFVEGISAFCYDEPDCGPKSSLWYGECQTGTRQSPIDLSRGISTPESEPEGRLKFTRGYHSSEYEVQCNGHTVVITLPNSTTDAQMTGDGLDGTYTLAQAHFHWGENSSTGSEHTIEGFHSAMEVHFVHYNSKTYSSLQEAAASSGDPAALAVVARLLQPTQERLCDTSETTTGDEAASTFSVIAQNLPIEMTSTFQAVYQSINLHDLLPTPGEHFYRYSGSLTTPPCSEIVSWIVVESPKSVKFCDYRQFHEVKGGEGTEKVIEWNNRPTYPLGDRTVTYIRHA